MLRIDVRYPDLGQAAVIDSGKLATRCLTLARQYGGPEWSQLQVLLEAMTR